MNKKTRSYKIIPIVLFIALLFSIPFYVQSNFVMGLFITCCLNITLALGMGLQYYTGMFGLAHMAFMGIGAYTSALAATRLGWPFWLSFLAAGGSALFFGLAFGYIVLRLRRMYFFLVSFMVAGIIETTFTNFFRGLFGGHEGITRIPPPEPIIIGALKIDFTSYGHYYHLILVIMLVTVFILYRLNKSPFGLAFNSLRMAPDLVRHFGINVLEYKVLSFSIGCFFAGIAGSFFAHFHHTIAPVDFGMWPCVAVQILVILGGQHYYWGPLVGAVIMTFLFGYLARFGFYQQIAYGGMLLLVMLFVPEGLMSLVPKIPRFPRAGQNAPAEKLMQRVPAEGKRQQ